MNSQNFSLDESNLIAEEKVNVIKIADKNLKKPVKLQNH